MAHPGIIYLDDMPRTRRKSNAFGILGCLFSILGIFTFGLASPIGLGLSMIGMTGRPRGAATFGAVVGAMGTAFLLLWGGTLVAGVSAANHASNLHKTEKSLSAAVATIEQYKRDHKRLPEDIDGNKLLIRAEVNDAWGTSLRFDPTDGNGYLVRSAGPDGQFDTGDDLTRS
jgi:hypothetical protein